MKKLMMSTAVITVIVTILMAVLFVNFETDVLFSLAITFGTIAYHFVMRILVGGIVNTIMCNKADYSKKWYRLRPFEEKLYKKLKVKNWKKKMPTYDPDIFDIKKKYSNEKIVEIFYENMNGKIPNIKNTEIISNENNVIKIKIDTKKKTVSDITLEYSKICEIKDINVIEKSIDDIIYNLYEEFHI